MGDDSRVPAPPSEDPRQRRAVAAVAASGAVATIGCLWLLHLRLLPLGLPGEWLWPQRAVPFWPGPGVLITVGVLLVGGSLAIDAARRQKLARGQAAAALALLLVGSCLLPTRFVLAEPGGYARCMLSIFSDLSMGYLSEVTEAQGLRPWLADTARRVDTGKVPARVATHPPGPVAFFWAADRLVRDHPGLQRLALAPVRAMHITATDMIAAASRVGSGKWTTESVAAASAGMWLLMMAAPVTVLGVFLLAGWWLGPREALAAAALSAAIPSLYVFTPGIDAAAAALTIWTMALWAWSLRRGKAFWPAGIVLGLGLQWTFGLAILALPLALMWLWAGRRGGLRAFVELALGIVAAHVPLVALGYSPAASFAGSMAAQYHIMASRHRLPWTIMNAWDFILFAGPALVALASAAGLRDRRLGLAVGITILLLLAGGATRGEVGRIWCFLVPPLAVSAGAALAAVTESAFVLGGTVCLLAGLTMTMGLATYLLLVTP